jgi:hypothetical protein
MKTYSIVRIGDEYVVQADQKSVLKIASRRMAARLVSDAAELLDSQSSRQPNAEPSIARDPKGIPDPHRVIPDPHGVIPDPLRVIPDPHEVP